jgi:thymidylate synthase (FAD)
MRIVEPGYKIEWGIAQDVAIRQIELAARNCYKTEDKIGEGTAENLIKGTLLNLGHHAMIEFADICIRTICDRGVTHELVRHRLPSFAQESTRYCNYGKEKFGKEITLINPFGIEKGTTAYNAWWNGCREAESSYFALLDEGVSPQWARSVLPNSLKTEILTKTNVREWRHIFQMRAINPAAHPQIRQVMIPALLELVKRIPVLFEDIMPEDGKFLNRDGSEFPVEYYAKEIGE